ncbi:MAG: glycosyltransferase [Clostridia bacterium]|nr:glycosyltransferase [Clostridia bacterium]
MERIKVLHVIGGGELGGAEMHILNLLTHMDRERFEVRLCCLFPEPFVQVARANGIATDAVVMRHKLNIGIVDNLMEIIRGHQIDIVHTHGVRANLVGRLAAKLAGIKHIVTTVHSVLEQDYPSFFARQVNRLMERITINSVERFVTVSDLLKQDLVGHGIPAVKITTIYNGVNLAAFRQERVTGDVRKDLGIAPDVPVLGMIARFHPVKGHRFFLEAAKTISRVRPDCRFLLVGSGQYRSEVEAMVKQLGLREQVIFTGYREDIVDVLHSLDILVISSLSEGFGLTAIEAMAMKAPVVATRVGGLPEIIKDGNNGILVPPADGQAIAQAVLDLLADPEDSRAMAARAFEHVRENFSVEIMAKNTEQLYCSLMSRKP